MLSHDPHAAGSIDRRLYETMVLLDAGSLERLYRAPPRPAYQRGQRPGLDASLRGLLVASEVPVAALVAFTRALGRTVPADILGRRFGGTEEAIIARGSDWGTDVARVACVLAQMGGMAARLVYLFALGRPYHMHAVIEVHHAGAWGVADPLTGIVYLGADGRPLSAAALQAAPALVVALHDRLGAAAPAKAGGLDAQAHSELYGTVCIAEYAISDTQRFSFPVSTSNHYTRTVLDMAQKGWPGGQRWLFGEDA